MSAIPAAPLPRRRRTHLLACLALAAVLASGCAREAEDVAATTTVDTALAVCDAWAELVTSFEGYQELDLLGGGLGGVRAYLDDVTEAAGTLAVAAGNHLRPEVQAFGSAVQELGATLASPTQALDPEAGLAQAGDKVEAAWDDLVSAFSVECPAVPAEPFGPVDPGAT